MPQDDMLNEAEGEASTDDIKTLFSIHRADLDALKERVAADLEGNTIPETDGVWCQYDDLFFLRFLLSFKTVDAALPNVLRTMEWRALPETQEIITKLVADGKEMESAVMRAAHSYQVGGILPGNSQRTGGPTVLVRGGMNNMDALFENVTIKDQQTVGFIWREQSFFQADRATRSSGKLAKQVLIFDMNDMQFSQMMDRRMQSVHGEVSAKCAIYYPQLLAKMCMVNTPSWVYWVIAFFKTILPKRNTDKMEVFADSKDLWKSEWGRATFDQSYIPSCLGGTIEDEKLGQYLTGELLVPVDDEASWVSLSVPCRDSKSVECDVPMANLGVKYSVNVAGYGIGVRASLTSPDGKRTETLLEDAKFKATAGLSSGVLIAPFAGTLTFVFDNTYSMMRWKYVKYKLQLDEGAGPTAVVSE